MFLLTPIYLVYLIWVITAVFKSFSRDENSNQNSFNDSLIIFSEIVFTIAGPIIGFMRYDKYGPDIPFAKHHVFSIILLVIAASSSFWLASFTSKNKNPILRIILSVGMLQGIVLCFVVTIHFIPYILSGIIFPLFGFELLSPVMALLLLIRAFYFYNKDEVDLNELIPYHEKIGLPLPYQLFNMSFSKRIIFYLLLLVPLIAAQVFVAYACGQDIDSLVKAFTHSRGFTFSSGY